MLHKVRSLLFWICARGLLFHGCCIHLKLAHFTTLVLKPCTGVTKTKVKLLTGTSSKISGDPSTCLKETVATSASTETRSPTSIEQTKLVCLHVAELCFRVVALTQLRFLTLLPGMPWCRIQSSLFEVVACLVLSELTDPHMEKKEVSITTPPGRAWFEALIFATLP